MALTFEQNLQFENPLDLESVWDEDHFFGRMNIRIHSLPYIMDK